MDWTGKGNFIVTGVESSRDISQMFTVVQITGTVRCWFGFQERE